MCSEDVAKQALVHADKENMTNGDYVFIIVIMSPMLFDSYIESPFKWFLSVYDEMDEASENALKRAFQSTLLVGPTINHANDKVRQFVKSVKEKTSSDPFNSDFYERNAGQPVCFLLMGRSLKLYCRARSFNLN